MLERRTPKRRKPINKGAPAAQRMTGLVKCSDMKLKDISMYYCSASLFFISLLPLRAPVAQTVFPSLSSVRQCLRSAAQRGHQIMFKTNSLFNDGV